MSELKIKAAQAALNYISDHSIIGVGTGSTVNCLIKELSTIKHKIDACVASSLATASLLSASGIPLIDLNSLDELLIYIDGADEVTAQGEMIKGGGGALTREKISALCAKQFICIVDESKVVTHLGTFPLAVEVIPMARSFVARELVKLGGDPEYRQGFKTDNGNIILDVHHLIFADPKTLEKQIKTITGVVESGLFAHRIADKVIVASSKGVYELK